MSWQFKMAPKARKFMQVDVFPSSDKPLSGNPVAVVVSSEDLSNEEMQKFASWTNLSETTFLLPPTDPSKADYKLRIFTITRELPFAGHPTLGSCRAWLQSGGQPNKSEEIVQECGIGLVSIKRDESTGFLSFAAPDFIREGDVSKEDLEIMCRAMGIPTSDVLASRWIDNGPGWAGLILKSAQDVLAIKTDKINQAGLINWGVVGAYHKGQRFVHYGLKGESTELGAEDVESPEDDFSPHFELRAFCPNESFVEDPVTGSLK
ncbi:hypothetical protein FRC07_004346 [Ceratobasidium sp. 392]|nr:hypothetical protein FRC07_004346 [Ceratobasidium sp. 392]